MAYKIQIRRDTAANWTAADPVLAKGEQGWESNTNKMKIGDGVKTWTQLDYFGGDSSGGGSGYMLELSENPTYNADGTVKIIKQAYVTDPTKYFEQRFEYTNGLATKIEIKDDLADKWVRHTNIYDGNSQLQVPTITGITAWTII